MMYVPEELRAKANLYEERNKLYGNNYKIHGHVIKPIWDAANIKLNTANDHNRISIIDKLYDKLSRYMMQFNRGGHDDSLDDIVVYAMMLKELDHHHEISERGSQEETEFSDAVDMEQLVQLPKRRRKSNKRR